MPSLVRSALVLEGAFRLSEEVGECERILIIDDNRDVRESLVDFLVAAGYRVSAARHGKDALAELREDSPPTLIFLDLMMPVMNGWEFRAALDQLAGKDRHRVVTLSSVNTAFDEEARIESDASILKPVALTEVLTLAERFCRSETRTRISRELRG